MQNRRRLLALLLCAWPLVVAAQAQPLPRVVVLATGGTIASKYDAAAGGLVAALTGADLVEAVPGLASLARVEVEQVANIGSSNMTPAVAESCFV